MRAPFKRGGGFTLLEVLVSLTILATSYAVVLQIFGGAARKAALSGDYRRALIIAESQLDYAAATVGNRGLIRSGSADGKFTWEATFSPSGEYLIEGLPVRYTPVTVAVEVSWGTPGGGERSVSVSTIRLTRGQAG